MSVRPSKHEIFNAAAELAGEERAAFLERACAGDAALRGEVEELLRHDADAGSFLGGPAAPEPPLESPGATIGPYKLLEQIGEGGFGVVFMAEQTAPVKRRVALKVIKPGMDTRQVIARFEAERQALALMDHPNIARVLDAGTTGTGRPFFVMELVRGVPITDYCDAHRLTPRERLELFVTVCHAVQHAHQKGIIHRDIKPSNVLVTLHDDRPVAKVIDFGVAKATSGQLTEKTVFTAFAQMIGTPLYMSPEQAASALDVDTRSDVYSLGVLLYELLTGTTPFDKARLKEAAFDEVRRIIREEEPATPSTRLSTSDALPSVAANRGTEPSKLTRLVRGELDWIVMRALEKDRTRRYETANGFAADVQRYLADEAVSACPPSAGYRLRKLVSRNRRALVVAALLSALLLVVAVSLGWIARDGAARRGRTAEAVAGLLDRCEDALRAEQPDQAAMALETAERRSAEGGAEELEGRLVRCRAELKLLRDLDAIDAFSWTWTRDTRPSLEAMAARWRAAFAGYGVAPDEGRAGEAAALVNASFLRDRALNALDRWLAAEASAGLRALLRTADPDPYRDAVRDAIAARDAPALIALAARPEALAQPAWFAAFLGTLGDVPPFGDLPVHRQRVVMESALGARPGDLTLLMGLGNSYGEVEQGVSERLRWFQAAVAAHPRSVPARNNLGVTLAPGDPERAIVCFQEAIRLDPTFVRGRCNLAAAFSRKGDLDSAIACAEEAIRLDPNDAFAHFTLGTFKLKGDPDRAIACFQEAIRLEPNHAAYHYALADAFAAHGHGERAIASFEEAIRLDPKLASAHYCLGNSFFAKKELDQAIACYREAIRLDPTYAVAHSNLGVALAANGELDRAIDCFKEAIRLDPKHVLAQLHLGNGYFAKGERDRAIACYREAIRLDPGYAKAHNNLGNALLANGELHGAIACYQEAIRLDPSAAAPRFNLGNEYQRRGELEKAIASYREAIRLDPNDADARFKLGNALIAKGDAAEAITRYEEAIRLNPKLVAAHGNLGNALAAKGEPDQAITCFEEAIRLDPTSAIARRLLGDALLSKGDPDKAIASYGEAVRLDPNFARAHYGMGLALARKGDLVGAVAAYRKTIEADAGFAEAYCNLGAALQELGQFAEALEFRRKGHELGSRRPGWSYPSDTWVRETEQLVALDARLPQVLAGHEATPDEQLWLAQFCTRFKKRHVDAAALYGPAFAAEPALAEQMDRPRYEAACAAALAAAGHGVGAETLGASDKARLRAQALDWLRAELAAFGDLPAGDPGVAERVRTSLQRWLGEPALGGLRDAAALATLPAEERERWTKLWSDVRDLMARMASR